MLKGNDRLISGSVVEEPSFGSPTETKMRVVRLLMSSGEIATGLNAGFGSACFSLIFSCLATRPEVSNSRRRIKHDLAWLGSTSLRRDGYGKGNGSCGRRRRLYRLAHMSGSGEQRVPARCL